MQYLHPAFSYHHQVLIAFLLAAALLQEQAPRPVVKNERGMLPVNKTYFDLAANTGGDIYFWAPGEFASAKLQVPLPGVPVVLSYGSMPSAKKVFEIPVESGVQSLAIFAAVQRKDLAVLVRPDNTPFDGAQIFQNMLIATVTAPVTGVWRLELDGEGMYAVTAHVKPGENAPSFRFDGCDFVNVDGSPIVQEKCAPPSVPYRVIVRGVDASGAQFQRIESHVHPAAN